jgi:hypothetical protein
MLRASPPPLTSLFWVRDCVCVRKSGDNYGSADAFSKNPRVVAFRSQKRSRRLRRRELRPGHVAVWRRAERRFNNAAGPGKLGTISAAPSITFASSPARLSSIAPDDGTRRIQLLVGRLLDSTRVRASSLLAPSIAQTFKYAADCCSRTFARACNFRVTKYYSPDNHQPELEYVPYHRSCVSSSRIHCCIFGARLIPLRLAESAGRAAELVWNSRASLKGISVCRTTARAS